MNANALNPEAFGRHHAATRLVCSLLGLLLLAAAALKLHGMGVDPVARSGVFSAPAFQFLLIVLEILLGVWLLSGRNQLGSWLAALIAFLAFAAVSFQQGWIGRASCGCFGKVAVNPWITFGFDLAALTALLLARPDLKPLWHQRTRVTLAGARILLGYLVLLGAVAGYAHYRHGSIDAALASLRNERLSVKPGLIDMGEGVPGETREASVELTNRTDGPIRLIGGTSDCSCTVLGDLPLTIPPRETRSITVTVGLPNAHGRFDRKAHLTIDDQGFNTVGLRLTGRIARAPE